ncbi:MAG: hypothetical protein HYR48_00850 [Gemmatimonadetes bacterium]|nr:hypothetical protein [Gemmatimonadota bacterium]
MTTSPGPSPSELDTVRQILFGADMARLDQALTNDRQAAATRTAELEQRVDRSLAELERRIERKIDEMSQRVTAQLDDLSRRQQAHAERVTQLLDQVMAELARRADSLQAETRAGLEELRAKAADLDRRKLSVADFGSSLATLGQRFSGASTEEPGRPG